MCWTFRDFLPMVTPRLLRAPHPYLSFSHMTSGCVVPSNIYWLDAWETTLLLRPILWPYCSLGLKMVAGIGFEPMMNRVWTCRFRPTNLSRSQRKTWCANSSQLNFEVAVGTIGKRARNVCLITEGKIAVSSSKWKLFNRERLSTFAEFFWLLQVPLERGLSLSDNQSFVHKLKSCCMNP